MGQPVGMVAPPGPSTPTPWQQQEAPTHGAGVVPGTDNFAVVGRVADKIVHAAARTHRDKTWKDTGCKLNMENSAHQGEGVDVPTRFYPIFLAPPAPLQKGVEQPPVLEYSKSHATRPNDDSLGSFQLLLEAGLAITLTTPCQGQTATMVRLVEI